MNFNEYKQTLKREINFDNIPKYFKNKPNWVLWKLVKDNDPNAKKDYKKIPFNIDEKTGEVNYKVSSKDPNTWDTFENVKKHYETLSEVAGIWFAIDDERLFFLDIDGVKDHYLIDDLSGVTYGELSPSQEGYHFFLQSSEPFNHKKKDSTNTLELYSGIGRFASFTGFSIDEDVNEVIQDNEKVKEIIKNHFETNSDEKPIVVNFEDINNRKGKCNLSVEEILDIAKNNKYRGEDYTAIIEGRFEDARNYKGERFVDEGGVIDISRADFSLMQEIARITKGDREKMFEVYRNTPDWYRKDNDHNVGRIGNTIDTAIRKYFEKASFELPYENELKKQLEQTSDTKLKEEYILSSTGAIKKVFSNLELALKKLGISSRLKYNEFTDEVIYLNEEVNDFHLIKFRSDISKEIEVDFTTKDILQAVTNLALKNKYHPVKQIIEGKEWDKIERVETFFIDYLGAEDSEYTRTLAKRWLTGAVARIYKPGTKFEIVPIFHGKQGIGKSTIGNKLAGEYFTDSLQGMSNKDDLLLLIGKWIVELGELSAMSKERSERVKHFISVESDRIRKPYGTTSQDYDRTCVFYGTTNNPHFLNDITGNRRFFPVERVSEPIKDIFNISSETVQQLWAEAYEYYKNGTRIFYTEEEQDYIEKNYRNDVLYEDELLIRIKHFINMKVPSDFYELKLFEQKQVFENGNISTTHMYRDNFEHQLEKIHVRTMVEIIGYDPLNQQFNSVLNKANMYMNNFEEWERKKSVRINQKVSTGFERV